MIKAIKNTKRDVFNNILIYEQKNQFESCKNIGIIVVPF